MTWLNEDGTIKPGIMNHLLGLRDLKKGWDSYDADPPTNGAVQGAKDFILASVWLPLPIVTVNPSVVGGIGITYERGKRTVYVEFRNTGSCHVAYMGDGRPRVKRVVNSNHGRADAAIEISRFLEATP